MRRRSALACATLGSLALAYPALSQTWPARPIQIVAGFPPGTSVDLLARWVAEQLSRSLGQPVVIENRPGADGGLAAAQVARARPDGYTLLYTTSSAHGASPSLYRTLNFDPIGDFTPVTKLVDQSMLLMVRPDDPARSLGDLVARARSAPRPLFYGHGNTSTRVAAELLRAQMRIPLERVQYRGNPLALQDLIAGRIDFAFTDFTTGVEQARQGLLRPVAVTSARRNAQLPDVATMAEQGMPGFDLVAWGGIVAPAGTPAGIVARLSMEIARIVVTPEATTFFDRIGLVAAPMSPAEFGDYIRAEIGRWREYVTVAGIEPQ